MTKKLLIITLALFSFISKAQLPNKVLVGYWHNWGSLRLVNLDDRYNVIALAFAEADINNSQDDNSVYDLEFTVSNFMHNSLLVDIPQVQSEGKRVIMSVGGANGSFLLNSTAEKNHFVNMMKGWIQTYGLDGIDIDIERPAYICPTTSNHTLSNPPAHIQRLIDACKELDTWFETTYNREMILATAPEVRYTSGGLSPWQPCNGYLLSFLEQLNDELDLVMVQLYNSGSNYSVPGWNGGATTEYFVGNEDYIITQTEAIIEGFTPSNSTISGTYSGFPASKVVVALPANGCSAGSGSVSSTVISNAVNYLMGTGNKPGSYTLSSSYPDLRGLMTWSINNDQQTGGCFGGSYEFAQAFEDIFGSQTSNGIDNVSNKSFEMFPNPTTGNLNLSGLPLNSNLVIVDISGRIVLEQTIFNNTLVLDLNQLEKGTYIISVDKMAKPIIIK
jgi:chitinase